MEQRGISKEKADKQVNSAISAFPFALVENYDELIPNLTLPDPDDCHVLAAAITCNATVIVTENIKDFPAEVLEIYGIEAKTSDDFLANIIDLNPDVALDAFRLMVLVKENPPLTEYQVLDRMEKYRVNGDCRSYTSEVGIITVLNKNEDNCPLPMPAEYHISLLLVNHGNTFPFACIF